MNEAFMNEIRPETIAPALRGLSKCAAHPVVMFRTPADAGAAVQGSGLSAVSVPAAPDADAFFATLREMGEALATADVVSVDGIGMFIIAPTRAACEAKYDALCSHVPYEQIEGPSITKQRLAGRVIVVTGGAQGFGKGIAEILADNGAQLILPDINVELAEEVAKALNERTGEDNARAIYCDVSDEASVREMCEWVTREYGGIDVMHSNAGICIAGSLENLRAEQFELVTKINYTGFFHVCKYASRPMKIQSLFDETYFADIIQTNSKAGLKGWLNNAAYCGSKFGSIGLVQSISRELVQYRIKVNAVCPGNYYDGPLWGDPVKGLFVKYFEAGKVAGAKGPEDVRDWYFSQEIFGRGCYPLDVARAIMYCIEQLYETGQAVPVAGGLDMLS